MIKKRTRMELYNKFRQGAMPSGVDFAELVRSQLNLLDDGFDIPEIPDDPICLRAHGAKENILDFAGMDGQKRWRISGRCEDESKEGLNLTADERSRLYIERETGNIGINTDHPQAKLHLIQTQADNALRIDDEGSDTTPFVIDSSGRVGIGTGSPSAKLHLSYDGAGDVLRVDDTNDDLTPFIIDNQGKVGIGTDQPDAKLTIIDGGVSIGSNHNPGTNNLHVEGNLTVGGLLVVSGEQSVASELILKDNVRIIGDPYQSDGDSRGNLSVEGDTTLGTFHLDNYVIINGELLSGGNPETGEEQYELEINNALTVNRDPASLQATVKGDFTVKGSTTLGDTSSDSITFMGMVQTDLTLQTSTPGGNIGINFCSNNYPSTLDKGSIRWYDDLNTYAYWGASSAENGALVIEAANDGQNVNSDVVALKSPAAVIIDAPQLIKHGSPYTVIVDSNNRVRSVYNDLAEMMPDLELTAPGDVCVWDERLGGIRKSFQEDDPRVVGVHSDSYGFILGIPPEDQSGKEGQFSPIGLAGQVWVKAKGVKAGDLLTSSSEPGVAKASTQLIPGSIFAKALESAPDEAVKRIRALIMVR